MSPYAPFKTPGEINIVAIVGPEGLDALSLLLALVKALRVSL